MLVYLYQYRSGDAGHARESAAVDHDSESYFDVDDLAVDEWERIERDGTDLQRRARQFDEVTAVSVPEGAGDADLPGKTIQLRVDGGEEYVEHAELIEIQDPDP